MSDLLIVKINKKLKKISRWNHSEEYDLMKIIKNID